MTSGIGQSLGREEKTEQMENSFRLVFRREEKTEQIENSFVQFLGRRRKIEENRIENGSVNESSFQEREERKKKIENGFC